MTSRTQKPIYFVLILLLLTVEQSSQPLSNEDDYVFDEWDPYGDMEEITERMNRIFSQGFRHWMSKSKIGDMMDAPIYEPAMDLKETDEEYVMDIDVPGMKKEQIELTVTDAVLMIKGTREGASNEAQEDADGELRYYKQERRFGSFQRTVPLPNDADDERITAEYDNGVLTITIKKKEITEETPKERTITIL